MLIHSMYGTCTHVTGNPDVIRSQHIKTVTMTVVAITALPGLVIHHQIPVTPVPNIVRLMWNNPKHSLMLKCFVYNKIVLCAPLC